ncbi:hypothetical protein M441DRAFT_149409 [Trichoderma asperellum CBS 433.97]|uniref:Nucleoside phosphorylase domain-containing protein n=2 Tax=Trichoderma asperellum TaxID=101201 RepID=A0A2T3YY52_TRIA4|nr:hypothetical protein M441DRAFT_149409 [Trichoderma asperellum CBS 433.97]PTB37467.1 hypothetical protein M441DRAFT_149409 [Trichoderma asperellum CBS 433.97]
MRHTDIKQSTQEIADHDISDTATEYSDESRSTFSKKRSFIWELANELFKNISSLNVDEMTQARVSNILPELLQAFALKVGYGAKTQMHRDVMAFVHRHRREIATEFADIGFKDSDDSNLKKRRAEGMSWQDRTSLWFEKTSFETEESPEEPVQSTTRDDEALEDDVPDEYGEVPESWLIAYRKLLTGSSAYEELLARLQREFYLVPAELNIMGEIRGRIISSLPSPHKVSRRISPRSCHAIFQLDWDIIDFFNTQGYLKESYEVFEGVITITGSCQDAQAATCAQYIKQTWPFIGEIVIRLVKDVLKGASHVYLLPDRTAITAWIDTPKFMLEVYGVSVSIAEIGELFSWLGAALRTSPRHNGLMYCVPNVRNIDSNTALLTHIMTPPSSTLVIYEIKFAMNIAPRSLPAANGQCWHDIFRNPIIVGGYPIPQRLKWNTGLEIPLNIMAGLARTRRVNRFKEKVYIKGFSTMLVPTEKNTDMICWHLIYNEDGDHISYLDDDQDQEQYIGQLDLENYRHVLGWCSEAKLYAGSAGARHPVTHSRLPKPHTGCALSGVSVSEGKMILNGPEFCIGAKDTPVYISRKGNIRRLKWISTKFILLWDERDKRGWLINGTTALLHIIRAFLSHAKEDNFKSAFYFKDEDLQEAETPFTADSAIAVLLNPHNRRLKLYEEDDDDDDDEYLFKTQIDHFYNLLEKLIDHQADIAGDCGTKLSNNPRRYLEGWDFEDVAKECPTLYPRVATIADAGKGWVDFIRAIHAVTLVGRGFGDIIKPVGRSQCDSWATLPTKRYYIASCVSDLDRLLKLAGCHQDGHAMLCDNMIYHTPASVYMSCQCRGTLGQKHCEPVRTIIPSSMSMDVPFINHPSQSRDLGAVILGYNSHFPLIWGDTGPPQQGELMEKEPSPKAIKENVDSGFGSNSIVSEIESPSIPQSTPETQYSARPRDLYPERAKKLVQNLTIPADSETNSWKQYAVGIICPLAKELKAVLALFDNNHCSPSPESEDSDIYFLGDMAGHWVVATCLPATEYGTNSAAATAANLKSRFSSIRFCLLVGIAGGVPSEEKDIRLGDVVVSQPTGTSPGVIQYDLGKEEDGNHFRLTGSLQRPPRVLMRAISAMEANLEPPAGRLNKNLCIIADRFPEYKYPGQDLDITYQAACASCVLHQACLGSCSHIRQRVPRTTTTPMIHYGLVASGNRVIKNLTVRNQVAQEHGILCFEMEAAGVMNTVDCLVIRGISDYCDAQKNDIWQEYAAATAAAYAKLLLGFVPKTKRPGADSTERNGDMALTKKRKLDQ